MAQIALTSDQLETLRGTVAGYSTFTNRVRISVCPNDVVYSMRVNQATFTDSFAQITYDGGSGTLADVLPGMRVILSHTNDMTLGYWAGRVRKSPSAPTLYINETSIEVSDNDYIWVIDDFQIADKLAREVSSVQYNDWDISFRQLLPVVYNLKSVYAGDISGGVLTLSLAPLALAATSGASISSWSWNVGDGTITVGSGSTQNITVTFPEGHRWIHLTVTDNGGRAAVRHIEVHAHGSTYTYQLMSVENVQITASVGTGYDATLTNYVAPAGLLDLTQITIWSDDTYQDLDGPLTGDNIIFMGRIRNRDNTTQASAQYTRESKADYTVEGPLTQLARTEQPPFEMLNVASPTKWSHITNLTIWRAIAYLLSEYSTFLELHNLEFDSTANTYLAPVRNPSGDVLAAANDLAFSINAALQINGAGQVEVVRHACMLENSTLRNALVVRADLTTSDLISINWKQDGARPVGKLSAAAGSYNSTTGIYTVTEALAPGVAQDGGSQTRTLDKQVLTANLGQVAADSALKVRATNALEMAQEQEKLEAVFAPGWYSALIPSLNTWYTFTGDADLTVDGVETTKTVLSDDIRWLLTDIDLSLNAEGVPEIKASFIRETVGITKGLTIVYPPQSGPTVPNYPPVPSIPSFPVPPIYIPPLPTGPEVPVPVVLTLTRDGSTAIIGGELDGVQSLLLTTTLRTMASPYTRDIVPSTLDADDVIEQALFDPFTTRGAYLLTSNATDESSRFWYTDDFSAYPVVWTAGDSFDGLYTEMRTCNANGSIIATGTSAGPWTLTFDFTVNDGGWVGLDSGATYGGGGWQSVTGHGGKVIYIEYTSATSMTVTSVELIYTFSGTPASDNGHITVGTGSASWVGDTATTVDRTESVSGRDTTIQIDIGNGGGSSPDITLTSIIISGVGNPPAGAVGGSSGFTSQFSANQGGSVTGVQIIDTLSAWIDPAKASTTILAGGNGQTRSDTSGGAWSDYGSAKTQGCGYVPRYLHTATGGNSSTNPQYILLASALDAGESMWAVSAVGAAFADITPVSGGDEGLSTGPRCLSVHWLSSGSATHILALADFGGTVKLAVSLDRGSTWSFSAALDADAFAITTMRGETSKKYAAFVNGDKVALVVNYQSSLTITERTLPLDLIKSLDLYG